MALKRANGLQVIAILDDVSVDPLARPDDEGLVLSDARDECLLLRIGHLVDIANG